MSHLFWRIEVNSVLIFFFCSLGACSHPEDRVDFDLKIGSVDVRVGRVEVQHGHASVRDFGDGNLVLWAQAPALKIELERADDQPERWTLTILNAMPGAALSAVGGEGEELEVEVLTPLSATALRWRVKVPQKESVMLRYGLEDVSENAPFRFAVLSDVQEAVDGFQDIVERLNEDPSIRFVVSTGDLVEGGSREELERFQRELETLNIPFFSTVGNHEFIEGDPADWAELYGRTSFHWGFNGVSFSFVDSASGTVAPAVYGWLHEWLEEAEERVHVVLTHVPPLDPFGLRSGAFASRAEAAKLLTLLARYDVDMAFYGHIHSYYAFSNAGIPAYISGGGGAIPEAFDGVGRHFLVVDADANAASLEVSMQRVD